MTEPGNSFETPLNNFLQADIKSLEEVVGISSPGTKSYRVYESNVRCARLQISWTGNLSSLRNECGEGPLSFAFPIETLVARCVIDCTPAEFLERNDIVLLEVKRRDIASTVPGIYTVHMAIMGNTMYDPPGTESYNLVQPLVSSNGMSCSDTLVNGIHKHNDLEYVEMSRYVQDDKYRRYHRLRRKDVFEGATPSTSNSNIMIVPREHPVLLHVIKNIEMFHNFQTERNIPPRDQFVIEDRVKTPHGEGIAYRMHKDLFGYAANDFASKTLRNHNVIDKRQSIVFTIVSTSSEAGTFNDVVEKFGTVEHPDIEIAQHFSSDSQAALGSFSISVDITFHAVPVPRRM